MRERRSFIVLGLAAALVVACTPAAAPPPKTLDKLTVSFSNITPSVLSLWVAKDAGIFEKNGLDVDLQNIAGGQVLMSAIVAGQTPIGTLGGSEALSAASGGADISVIAVLVPYSPWAFYVPPSITNAEQLKGKKVAIVTVGGSADVATRVGLPMIGLDPDKDVTIVPTGSTPNLNAALLNGAVDGAATHPPDTTTMEAKGFHALFDLAKAHVESADTAVVVQKTFLNQNHDLVQRYVDSIVQGIAREKSDKAFAVSTLKKYMKLDDDAAASAAYDYYSVGIRQALPYPAPQQFKLAVDELGKKNPAIAQFDLAKLIDRSFVQSAADRGLAGKP